VGGMQGQATPCDKRLSDKSSAELHETSMQWDSSTQQSKLPNLSSPKGIIERERRKRTRKGERKGELVLAGQAASGGTGSAATTTAMSVVAEPASSVQTLVTCGRCQAKVADKLTLRQHLIDTHATIPHNMLWKLYRIQKRTINYYHFIVQ